MKRLVIIAAVLLLLVMTAGCSDNESSSSSKANKPSSETEQATAAPYIDTQINEPEWTLAEGNLKLLDQNNIYAEGKDFLYFAFVTNTDGTQELRFRFDETTASMLKKQSPDNAYYITLNDAKIGDATLNDDCTEAIIKEEDSNGSITENASKIRGLSE